MLDPSRVGGSWKERTRVGLGHSDSIFFRTEGEDEGRARANDRDALGHRHLFARAHTHGLGTAFCSFSVDTGRRTT